MHHQDKSGDFIGFIPNWEFISLAEGYPEGDQSHFHPI